MSELPDEAVREVRERATWCAIRTSRSRRSASRRESRRHRRSGPRPGLGLRPVAKARGEQLVKKRPQARRKTQRSRGVGRPRSGHLARRRCQPAEARAHTALARCSVWALRWPSSPPWTAAWAHATSRPPPGHRSSSAIAPRRLPADRLRYFRDATAPQRA